jgi:hypothetical protein
MERTRSILTAILAFAMASAVAWGQISLTTIGNAYTQDFDGLASSGTSSTVPSGWAFSESGTAANTTYTAGIGSSTTGDTYSFGSSGSTERAFGGLQSGSLIPMIGASFTNNTGVPLTSFAVSYTGEQWRLGATGRSDRIDFQLSVDATDLTTGTWTDYDDLDFSSPITTGTVGALDGNSAANRTALSFTITGLTIEDGVTFWIRWMDFNVSGFDDGLAVDDFSLTAESTPVPIQLASYTASVIRGHDVEVAWHTVSETNNYGFEVLRKRGNVGEWTTLAFLEGHGTTLAPQFYSYIDRSVPFGNYSYRVRQVDLDGKSETFPEMEVSVGVEPGKFILAQNHPNPFNLGTTIEFVVPQTGWATIKVYNLLGQEVATLFNANAEAGRLHSARFDGKNLASGLYWYSLSINGRIGTKRMLLLK